MCVYMFIYKYVSMFPCVQRSCAQAQMALLLKLKKNMQSLLQAGVDVGKLIQGQEPRCPYLPDQQFQEHACVQISTHIYIYIYTYRLAPIYIYTYMYACAFRSAYFFLLISTQ